MADKFTVELDEADLERLRGCVELSRDVAVAELTAAGIAIPPGLERNSNRLLQRLSSAEEVRPPWWKQPRGS